MLSVVAIRQYAQSFVLAQSLFQDLFADFEVVIDTAVKVLHRFPFRHSSGRRASACAVLGWVFECDSLVDGLVETFRIEI